MACLRADLNVLIFACIYFCKLKKFYFASTFFCEWQVFEDFEFVNFSPIEKRIWKRLIFLSRSMERQASYYGKNVVDWFWINQHFLSIHSVHPPAPFCRRGIEPPTKFSKRGELTEPQLLEGGCWERGGDFFQGGYNFHIKNKLKSEIFNDKKSL